MRMFHRYVALGDSFTKGFGDSVDGFGKIGAIDRLAAALRQTNPDLQFINLAKSGVSISEIREQQLEAALALAPDLITLVAGANDILKERFNAASWEHEFQVLLDKLSKTGAVIVTAGVPEFPLIKTLKETHQAGLTRIITKANLITQRQAERHQVIFIDSWAMSSLSVEGDWSQDGVHLNSRGYFKFAQEMIQMLELQLDVQLDMLET